MFHDLNRSLTQTDEAYREQVRILSVQLKNGLVSAIAVNQAQATLQTASAQLQDVRRARGATGAPQGLLTSNRSAPTIGACTPIHHVIPGRKASHPLPTRQPDLTAPRQERSRATQRRILGALARLLERTTFDQISVAELTSTAGCSMSSFYARFPTKDALLDAFLDHFFEFSAGEVSAALSKIAAAGEAARRARRLVEFMLRSYRDHRGLLRSLILHDRMHPDAGFGKRTRAYKKQVSAAFLSLLLGEDAGVVAPRLATSISFGLWLVIQAIEQIVLFDDPIMGRGQIPERQLIEQLTAILLHTLEPPEEA